MTKHVFGDRADNPRTGGRREHHNKPQHTEPPGKRLKGTPAETEHRGEHGSPPEKRSGAIFEPAARK
jgi:hypothetical protein